MHKLILLGCLLGAFTVTVRAATPQETLNFYIQEINVSSPQNTRENRAYARALASSLDTWAKAYPQDPSAQDAWLGQARMWLRAQDKGAAAVTLFQLRGLFPAADRAVLNPLFKETVEGFDKNYRSAATQLFEAAPAAADTALAREADVLYTLSKLAGTQFYPAAAQAFERFLQLHPTYTGNSEIELWYGDLHRANGNYLAAIFQYKKARALYPKSPYQAASLRLIGDIYADNLKNTEKATEAYTSVLRLYPNSAETGIVYKHMAILDENNKQYDSALINYDKAIELLGATPAGYEAYRGKADVYVKTKNFAEAYQWLHQTAAAFSTDKEHAAQALQEAAQIAERKMHDETKYIQSLEKAVALQPTAPATAQNMYELALAYERQNKTVQAQEAYKRLILNFPTHKYAAKAQARLTRLTK